MSRLNNVNNRDEFDNYFNEVSRVNSRVTGATVAIAIVWAFVITVLAAGAVALALNVSAWFWIAAVIVGAYATILWIGVSVAAYAKNRLDDIFDKI